MDNGRLQAQADEVALPDRRVRSCLDLDRLARARRLQRALQLAADLKPAERERLLHALAQRAGGAGMRSLSPPFVEQLRNVQLLPQSVIASCARLTFGLARRGLLFPSELVERVDRGLVIAPCLGELLDREPG